MVVLLCVFLASCSGNVKRTADGGVVSERLLTRMGQDGKLEVVERSLLEKVLGVGAVVPSDREIRFSGAGGVFLRTRQGGRIRRAGYGRQVN